MPNVYGCCNFKSIAIFEVLSVILIKYSLLNFYIKAVKIKISFRF